MTATIPDRNRTATTPDYELGVESFRDRQEWVPRAKCRDIDPDKLFVRGAAQREAAVICPTAQWFCSAVPTLWITASSSASGVA